MADEPPLTSPSSPIYPYPAARPTDGMAIAALVVGLISPFAAMFYGLPGVIFGSVAVFLGLRARSRIKRSGGTLAGGGMALAGWIVGVGAIVVGTLWFLFLLMLYMAMTSGNPGANSTGPPAFPTT
jgi:hypothetical protein